MDEQTRLELLNIAHAMSRQHGQAAPVGTFTSADGTSVKLIRDEDDVESLGGGVYENLLTLVTLYYRGMANGERFVNRERFLFRDRDVAIVSLREWHQNILSVLEARDEQVVREDFRDDWKASYMVTSRIETVEEQWMGVADLRPVYKIPREIFVSEKPPKQATLA